MRLAGHSYGDSLATPHRTRSRTLFRADLAAIVLEFVHPGHLGELPPSPARIAVKGEQLGLAAFGEFFLTRYY